MGYSIGKTPAIDEIVIKTLVIPVISPEINPLDTLDVIRGAIEEALDTNIAPKKKSDISKHYVSFEPRTLKAALRVIEKRIAYANALSDYLGVLYQENVGTDSGLTPHNQLEPTPRFNFKEIDYHLKVYLLQGTDDDMNPTGQGKKKSNPKNVIEKSIESAQTTSFLIADRFATGDKFIKSSGELNIDAISKAVALHAQKKYSLVDGQGDSSIKARLNAGKEALPKPNPK